MTTYIGESLLLSHTATYEGAALTNANTSTVTISLFTSDYVTEILSQPMTWNSTTSRWEYEWDTTGVTAGRYNVRVWLQTNAGAVNWEFFKVTVKADPAAAYAIIPV